MKKETKNILHLHRHFFFIKVICFVFFVTSCFLLICPIFFFYIFIVLYLAMSTFPLCILFFFCFLGNIFLVVVFFIILPVMLCSICLHVTFSAYFFYFLFKDYIYFFNKIIMKHARHKRNKSHLQKKRSTLKTDYKKEKFKKKKEPWCRKLVCVSFDQFSFVVLCLTF